MNARDAAFETVALAILDRLNFDTTMDEVKADAKDIAQLLDSHVGPQAGDCHCVVWAEHGIDHPRGHRATGCAFTAPLVTAASTEYAAAVPTNWCDPLLTGPNAVIGNPLYDCKDIERLLRALKSRIAALAPAVVNTACPRCGTQMETQSVCEQCGNRVAVVEPAATPPAWWCCSADYPNHDASCSNATFPAEVLVCPFCHESDFDLIGLKSHIAGGDCDAYENVEHVRRMRF